MEAAVSVRRGDGQHPGKSKVDIRPDAFASPNHNSRLDWQKVVLQNY